MSLQDFMHNYEMESLQLGITARRDVTLRIMEFFPSPEDDGLGSSFQATSQALAARRAAESSKREERPGATLVLAGNTREGFHRRLRNIQLVALANALHKSNVPGLVGLDFRYNYIGEHEEAGQHDAENGGEDDEGEARDEHEFLLESASSLGRLLQPTSPYPCQITELNLQGNRLGSESCRLLCTALDAAGLASPLRRLNLNGNPLGSVGGHAIAALLASSSCPLQEIDVGNTELNVSNLIAIAQSLRTNRSLKALNLDNLVVRSMEEEAIQYIGKALQVNTVLTNLSLAKHQMSDHGAQVLAERLLDNRSLRRLVLRANRIGSTGASALAAMMLRHPTLAEFDLSANRIGDAGAKAFAQVVRANMATPLEVLSLCSTSLTDEGMAAIATACLKPQKPEAGSRLRGLLLWGNVFGPKTSPLVLELCEPGGRFHENGVETDFLPRLVDGEVLVAHQKARHFSQFASPKRAVPKTSSNVQLSSVGSLVACNAAHRVWCLNGHYFSLHAPLKPATSSRLARWFSSSDAPASDESFASLADQVQREVQVIQDVVSTAHSKQELAGLREEAEASDLWDDATHAASVVQRLAALESRETRADELHRRFFDTKELHLMATEEDDEPMLRDCVNTMAVIRSDAQQLRLELLLSHESDTRSCFLEIQAGAGGTDSCDWTAMLARMYGRWGGARGFQVQHVDESVGDEAGFRSVVLRLDGAYAYGWAKSEAGVHRLVRISPFDSAGRRHTSFAQVRVYPMAAEGRSSEEIEISTKDLRIDTFRSSGPGGQHVNSTDSAIRITHLPTGIVVQSQSDRSQHRNKAEALAMLRAKLYQRKLEEETRKRQQFAQGLGENAWGNQIRSYVLHPYQLVKDHRTNYSEGNTGQVLDGDIDHFIEKMLLHQAASKSGDIEDRNPGVSNE
ncbi:unnamed protein product [Phytophthora fragariaefolia]|uniref:Unnamed protein product n=1 Tax=Phytophthora fragariaefolia TaxID=1490495 RepID=A0A9W6Y7V0_9STRA|nr:unnamed protein product [Phytophthora fragariaefolia]